MNRLRKAKTIGHSHIRQRGVVLVIFTIGMLAIIVMAGLALDVSHALLNKSRLQSTLDAAALTGAKTLDDTSSTDAARTAVLDLFGDNRLTAGNGEMAADVDSSEVKVEFSATLEPFTVGSAPARFVRVRVDSFNMGSWMIQVLGISQKTVRASAVAGPSPTIDLPCDLVPLIVCGDPDAGGPLWGYEQEQISVLKGSSKSGSEAGPIGPGNFQLAMMGSPGSAQLRENLAGGASVCATDDEITTEPGNAVGPVAQGLNTRLGVYSGPIRPSDYKPDVIVEQQDDPMTYDAATNTVSLRGQVVTDASDLDFNYSNYQTRKAGSPGSYDNPPPTGLPNRRTLPVVIADCDGRNSGRTELPILGIGCFFMLQEVTQKGTEAEVYGEFVESCLGSGNPGPNPQGQTEIYRIQLYKDDGSAELSPPLPASTDS